MLQLKSQQGLPVIGICNIDTGMDTDTNIDMDMDIGIDLDVDIDVDTNKDIQRDTHTYIYRDIIGLYSIHICIYTHTDRIHHNGKKEPSGAVVKLLYIIEMMKLLCSAGPGAESWISQC